MLNGHKRPNAFSERVQPLSNPVPSFYGVQYSSRTGEVEVQSQKSLVKTYLLAIDYAIYYAVLFFTTLFTTLREAPAPE